MQLVSHYFIKHADFGMPAERYQQLYQRFLDSLPEKNKILQQLEINNSQYNWTCPARPELQYYAHRLAGSAEMYGFSSIGRTAKQLDQLLIDYDRLELHDSYTQLREKISSTIALLRYQIGQAISQG
jgi:HPt (histidine-containing phosphotransfer) domain-containing protein